jgi:hypothetical protein
MKSVPVLDIILKQITVSSVNEIGTSESTGEKGVNHSLQLVDDKNKKYLWKDKNGEHVSSWRYVPPHTLYQREAAAYKVNKQLGFNMIPYTRVAKYEGQIGSLQDWIEPVDPADITLKSYSEDDIWKSGLIDLIIGNSDRHSGNWFSVGKHPLLIDHGYSFPSKAVANDNKSLILSRFAYAVWGQKIPEEYLQAMKNLQDPSFRRSLQKYLDKDALQLFNERLATMLADGKAEFPKYRVIKKLLNPPA